MPPWYNFHPTRPWHTYINIKPIKTISVETALFRQNTRDNNI